MWTCVALVCTVVGDPMCILEMLDVRLYLMTTVNKISKINELVSFRYTDVKNDIFINIGHINAVCKQTLVSVQSVQNIT